MRRRQGLTLQQTANEFHVHLNSIDAWRQRWNKEGLMGLDEGHHTGRKHKWTAEQQAALKSLAQADGGSANSLLRTLAQTESLPAISQKPTRRYLHEMHFNYKRYRYSWPFKKSMHRKLSARPHE
nr:helix-turn-helix domain-containing protein [Janthinobacterium sp. CG3]